MYPGLFRRICATLIDIGVFVESEAAVPLFE